MTDSATSPLFPLTVYGSNISYFTGKLEMYLRAKGIPYQFKTISRHLMATVVRGAGVHQIPAATLADGRWMTDSTPIIAFLEEQAPSPPLLPGDPEQRFFSLLLEDYADEWLWRPAMHFRWYGNEDAMHLSRHIAGEIKSGLPLPDWFIAFVMRQRQRGYYTRGDGITRQNRLQVEAIYHNNLSWLSRVLDERPFLLGSSPSLADIAFMGPMFRHFSNDPTPAEIMRQQAPAVWEWVARLWNTGPSELRGDWLSGVPDDWGPWLDDIGANYLPYLCENALAIDADKKRFSPSINGVTYRGAHTSRYRVWCLAQLRGHFSALPEDSQQQVRARLEQHNCWEPLWRKAPLDVDVNTRTRPPFGSNSKMLV